MGFAFQQIISAIHYLHNTAHLIHRDLKPENILITESGHIMVTDFGTITTSSERTRRNTMCGTILYLAPEVLLSTELPSRPFIANPWHLQSISGPLAACFIFSSLVVSFSKAKMSMFLYWWLFSRINVIESIDHFCVDLLEFPDYIPEDARVWWLKNGLLNRIWFDVCSIRTHWAE